MTIYRTGFCAKVKRAGAITCTAALASQHCGIADIGQNGQMNEQSTVTTLLRHWREGNQEALEQLTPLIYDDLRRIARRHLRGERKGHTLQATALVHEAFARLVDADIQYADRAHFFAVAARLMRRILTDYGRSRQAQKRGDGIPAITLNDTVIAGDDTTEQLLEIDDALERLHEIDARKSDILVLHYFGGMTYDESAQALGISAATVDRELRFGKAWLANELGED